jgi:hypothetical protein
MAELIPCPFIYGNGKSCPGYVARIEAYKADLEWSFDGSGWSFDFRPRSHYHVFCSEKGNHAGYKRGDRLKLYYDQLPAALQDVIAQTMPPAPAAASE